MTTCSPRPPNPCSSALCLVPGIEKELMKGSMRERGIYIVQMGEGSQISNPPLSLDSVGFCSSPNRKSLNSNPLWPAPQSTLQYWTSCAERAHIFKSCRSNRWPNMHQSYFLAKGRFFPVQFVLWSWIKDFFHDRPVDPEKHDAAEASEWITERIKAFYCSFGL